MAQIERGELDAAVRAGILSAAQAERLHAFLAGAGEAARGGEPLPDPVRFRFVHVLYYLGGMIAIGAMSLFMTLGWRAFGGWGGALIAMLYMLLALALTHWFIGRRHVVPAGIMATLAVALVPLAIFSVQWAVGYWENARDYRNYHAYIDWRWLTMEFGTLAVGAVLLWRYRFPFMLMPIAVTLWYMSMDLAPLLFGEGWFDIEIRKWVSMWFGLAMVLLAFWIDLRSRHSKDYAFWLYLFGVIAFWTGLSLLRSSTELDKFLYCMINLGMVLVGALLGRRVFAVFGGLGIAGYLGHLSWRIFRDSIVFPFALSALGLAIIALGIWWQRREAQWSAKLRTFLPAPLRELIEARAVR